MVLKNARILVIDDDVDILTAVRLLLKTEAAEVLTEKNPENIRSILYKNHFDLILLDMNFNSAINTGNEGLYWLRKIREWDASASVIMITAYGDIDLAVRSLKEGAVDFVVKPWHNEKLTTTIRETLQKKDGSLPVKTPEQAAGKGQTPFIGQSQLIKDIMAKVEKIAPTDANILIMGENGTGKDLMARMIHERSARSAKQFVKVDVGALTETLFESELFGHKKGAFTDARDDRTGRFEMASGGTLFLDEIGNITLQQQAKLLSVLQNRQVSRLGSNLLIPVDIRLICATNLPLTELANEARFRKDLIYRINTVEITMPPLRRRPDDIPPLAKEFAQLYASKYLKRTLELDNKAIEKLIRWIDKDLSPSLPDAHIDLRIDGATQSIPLDKILFIQSLGNYVKVFLDKKVLITQITTKELEGHLPRSSFLRIHKSYIVNKSRIDVVADEQLMIGNIELPIGKTFKKYVKELMHGY